MFNKFINIFAAVVICFIFAQTSFASQIVYDNETYVLRYSNISPHTKGYFNEYTKAKETIHNWNKLLIVHYYPDTKVTPQLKAAELRKLLSENKNAKLINSIYDKDNEVYIVSFAVTGSEDNLKFLEYSVFKYEKSIRNGVMALQYSQRYWLNTFAEAPSALETAKSTDAKNAELIKKMRMPKLVERKIGL